MKNYKNILMLLGKFMISLFIYLVIITLFAYFNIISYKTVSIISFIFTIILFIYSGFSLGKISTKRGYLSGLLIGSLNILVLLILSLILRSFPGLKSLLYFAILLLASTFGGMLGINKRKN